MTGEHKSYGFEGGFEDWNAGKVFSNMRLNREDVASESDAPDEPNEVVTETSTDEVEVVDSMDAIPDEENETVEE